MEKKPSVLRWALIIGIVIVLNLFFNYTISLFYKEPDYNSYFMQQQVVEPITTKEACLNVGGQWTENSVPTTGGEGYPVLDKSPIQVGSSQTTSYSQTNSYCNPDFTKQKEYNDAQKVYQRNIFIVLVVLGVISFALGIFISNEIVTLGLSWGGVLSFVVASTRYWSSADNIIKVLILGLALAILIWLAIKKFGNNHKKLIK